MTKFSLLYKGTQRAFTGGTSATTSGHVFVYAENREAAIARLTTWLAPQWDVTRVEDGPSEALFFTEEVQ